MTPEGDFNLIVPPSVYDAVVTTQGTYYEGISRLDRNKIADDVLSQEKAAQQATILQRYAHLQSQRVLEVGAGLGTNLITWTRSYGADMSGVEPDAFGFDSSFRLARELLAANGLDPERVVDGTGEHLPFADKSFDIVYSANVLEHTQEPECVLREALRVLRPGGVLQFVFPNYRSYYDGHYGVFHPPIFWRGFFPWYVRWIWRRNPEFARTLRTELNAHWTRKQVCALQLNGNVELLGLGDDLFVERMTSLDFATWATLGRVKSILKIIGSRGLRRALARTIVALNGWTPIVLTLRKTG